MLFLSIAAWGADKDKRFRAEAADTYATKQAHAGLTIAVVPYHTAEKMKSAFGKLNLSEYGVLPVLMVMKNDTGKTLRLADMAVDYVTPERFKVEATPSSEVQYLQGPKRPDFGGRPFPNPLPQRKKTNKLASYEIEGFAFNAKMLPAGESAHGFVYFQTNYQRGSMIYVRGIVEAQSGKELFYFEIPTE